MTDGPLLWFVNRGTGLVLLALLTAVMVLGIAARRTRAGTRLPGFVLPALHRNLSVLALALLAVHAGSAVVDEYVDIRWWQVLAPWELSYQPWWLAFGTIASDLLLAVLLTSAVRTRLGHGGWRAVHQLSYIAWVVGMVHGLGIGTDTSSGPARIAYVACASAVAVAVGLRVAVALRNRPAGREVAH